MKNRFFQPQMLITGLIASMLLYGCAGGGSGGGGGGDDGGGDGVNVNKNATFGAYYAYWSKYYDFTDFDAVKMDDFYMAFYRFGVRGTPDYNITAADSDMNNYCTDPWCTDPLWIKYLKSHPDVNFIMSFGGYYDADMFDLLDVDPSQFKAQTIADNLDNFIANNSALQAIGGVDGIDLDFELNENSKNHNPSTNQLKNVVKLTKELNARGYKVYLTVYSTSLDDPSNPSFPVLPNPDPNAINHTGEMLPLFDKSLGSGYDDIINYLTQLNMMLYDAGPGYDWDIAVGNAIAAVGEKNKGKLGFGLAQGRQWAPGGPFIEDVSELEARVKAAKKDFGISKFFIWALGTNYTLDPNGQGADYHVSDDITIINNLYGLVHGNKSLGVSSSTLAQQLHQSRLQDRKKIATNASVLK